MLKTNSRAVREAIKNYIIENYNADGYEPDSPEAQAQTFAQIAAAILSDVARVKGYEVQQYRGRYTWADAFADWAAGLPGLLDTCYYYNRSAVDDLGGILEQTEEERNRYTESQAESRLSGLIFRELVNAAPHALHF